MKKAINNHIKKLSKTIERLKIFKSPVECTISQKLSDRFEHDAKGNKFIYIIKTDSLDKGKILSQFKQFKKEKGNEFKLSSINDPTEFEGVLYVGSSESINSRLNQHLGHTGPRVYSLQLNKWFKLKSKIVIEIITIEKPFYDILYPLENALWDYHQPLFGKKGTNIKSSHHI